MNNLIKNTKCEDDAAACVLAKLKEGVKRRSENSIWGPIEMPVESENCNISYKSPSNYKGLKEKFLNSRESSLAKQKENYTATHVKVPKMMHRLSKIDVHEKNAHGRMLSVPSYQQENDKENDAIENDQHMESSEKSEQLYCSVSENNERSSDMLVENTTVINEHKNIVENNLTKKVPSPIGVTKDFKKWWKERSQVFMSKFNFANSDEQHSVFDNTKDQVLDYNEINVGIHEQNANSSKQVFGKVNDYDDDEEINTEVNQVKLKNENNNMVLPTLLSSKTSMDEFKNWCKERSRMSKPKCISSSELPSTTIDIKDVKENNVNEEKLPLMKVHSKDNSIKIPSKSAKNIYSIKNENTCQRNDTTNIAKDFSESESVKKNVRRLQTNRKIRLSVKLTEEGSNKNFEFMAEPLDIKRIRRKLPKLSAVIPDIDSGVKKINYCIEAVSIILRFVFSRNFNFGDMPSPTTCVEVIAASQSWEIHDFLEKFRGEFLQSVLTLSNVNLVFSYAKYFSLKDICDACLEVVSDNTSFKRVSYNKKDKICFISVSTYVEPNEIDIPFHPLNRDFGISFERHILNKFIFEAISGTYTITGFQMQLNEKHIQINEENKVLKIDYSIKRASTNQESKNGRGEKPLRPINVIYFKEHLVINPKEIVEIIVETDVRPYLCSEDKERTIHIKNHAKELNLTMESDFKIKNSDTKLFIVGKFFYYASV